MNGDIHLFEKAKMVSDQEMIAYREHRCKTSFDFFDASDGHNK